MIRRAAVAAACHRGCLGMSWPRSFLGLTQVRKLRMGIFMDIHQMIIWNYNDLYANIMDVLDQVGEMKCGYKIF